MLLGSISSISFRRVDGMILQVGWKTNGGVFFFLSFALMHIGSHPFQLLYIEKNAVLINSDDAIPDFIRSGSLKSLLFIFKVISVFMECSC